MRSISALRSTALCRRLVRKMLAAKVPLPEANETLYALFGLSPGYHQKAAGAWAWQLYVWQKGRWWPCTVGSCDPASVIVRKDRRVDFFHCHTTGDTEVLGEPL